VRIRALATAILTGSLAVAALAAPVAAGDDPATVWVAHGIPGAKVDVCAGGSAIKTDFTYGQRFKVELPAGSYTIRVRLAAHEDCQGKVVIKQTVGVTSGLNATAVAVVKGGTPQLAIYVNDTDAPPTSGFGSSSISVIHEAKAPAVDVWLAGPVRLAGISPQPTISDFTRGSQAGPVYLDSDVYTYWVSLPDTSAPVIGPRVTEFKDGRAYVVIAVGTNASNYRFITFSNPFTMS
jgi:hypothetical protein